MMAFILLLAILAGVYIVSVVIGHDAHELHIKIKDEEEDEEEE